MVDGILPRVSVGLGPRAVVVCLVAQTAAEQARGLQGRRLCAGEGMIFPFSPPRAATFHQGTVNYPIDLIFADASGQIGRIVHATSPGTRETWSHPITGCVVEVPGGFCARAGVSIGDCVTIGSQRFGSQAYNLLRGLTEASVDGNDGNDVDVVEHEAGPALMDGYYSKEPLKVVPEGEKDDIPVGDRYQDRDMFRDPNAMDGMSPHYVDNMGYFRPGEEGVVGPLRATRQRRADDSVRYDVELEEFVPAMIEAAARAGMPWGPTPNNSRRERAVVTPSVVGSWLHAIGVSDIDAAFSVATTPEALDLVGAGMIAAGFAETANIASLGDQHILVLTRNKELTHGLDG